jgi:hypothetical protein
MLMKLGCKRIIFHKFIPAKNRSKKSDRSDKINVELVEILDKKDDESNKSENKAKTKEIRSNANETTTSQL